MATTKATTKTTADKAPVKKAAPKAAKASGAARGTGAMAVIMTGGKQYKVKVGDTIKIEKIIGDMKVGDTLSFDQVVLLDDAGVTTVGMPMVAGSVVEGELKEIGRDPKILVVKYKQKSKYLKRRGHRQPYFKVAITSIA